ncbi:MAG: response regulator transcription factor [Pseudonocardiales bacterium]
MDAQETPTTRVLLVVNDALYRCGLRALLESRPDLEIVGEAHDCCEAAECLRHLDPSVVLLDPRGLGTSPVVAIRALSCRPLLVLASPSGEPVAEAAALRAGANGLLLNTANPEELVAALRVVVAGYTLHLPPTTGRICRQEEIHETSPDEVPKDFRNLTPHAVIYAYQNGLVTERGRSPVAGLGSDASAVA